MARLSHPVVHPHPDPAPVEAPAPPAPAPAQGQGNAGPNAPPGVEMRGPNPWVLAGYRLTQALLAAAALAAVASAHDFTSVTAFRYLISSAAFQCLWTLALAILFFYGLLVGRSFRDPRFFAVRCVGDWIAGSLSFSAACASAGITTFINNDLEACWENHCPSFMSATAMAFLSWFAIAPCCVVNLYNVVYRLQRQ
uniref:Uncharacterized protein n=1 Tax=Avena sativa TaxID=4498 RepID=A0ACD6A3Q7_AVESA